MYELLLFDNNKASGPDGFADEFYQVFGDVIKYDLLGLFNEFHNGSLPFFLSKKWFIAFIFTHFWYYYFVA